MTPLRLRPTTFSSEVAGQCLKCSGPIFFSLAETFIPLDIRQLKACLRSNERSSYHSPRRYTFLSTVKIGKSQLLD